MPTLLCIPSDLICDTKSQKTSRISLIKPEQQRLRSYYCDQIKEFIPGVPASFPQEFSKKSQNITKISFQFDELFKIKFRLTDSRFLLKTFQTKLAGTFPVFFTMVSWFFQPWFALKPLFYLMVSIGAWLQNPAPIWNWFWHIPATPNQLLFVRKIHWNLSEVWYAGSKSSHWSNLFFSIGI